MKKISENKKITLTFGQLRQLVNESYKDDVNREYYNLWLAFIKKFGAEAAAKILSYGNSSGERGISLAETINNFEEYDGGDEVIEILDSKATSLGLDDGATDVYECHAYTRFDKFLYDETGNGVHLYMAVEYDLVDKVKKALEAAKTAYVLIFEGYEDGVLDWAEAKEALAGKYNIVADGFIRGGDYQYMILTDK